MFIVTPWATTKNTTQKIFRKINDKEMKMAH